MFTFSERFSLLLFGFGSLYLLLRIFSKAEFGIWVLFLAITSIIEVSRTGLLQNTLVKHLTTSKQGESDYGKISTASLVLNVGLALFCIILLPIIAYPLSLFWESSALMPLLLIYCLTTLALIPLHQFNFTQQANLEFKGIFWANFTKQGLFFGYILFHYFYGLEIKLVGLASWQVVTTSCGAAVSFFFAKRFLSFSRKIHWDWVSRLFHYGKYVFGTNLSTMLYKSIDKMMLGSLLSPVSVAVYELAIRITNLAEVPTFSMASIVFPQSARQAVDGEGGVKQLYEKSVGAILAFILPAILIIMLVPEWVILIVAGEKYLDAVPILQLTMLYGLFVPFGVQFGTVLDSIGLPKINFYFTFAGALLNVLFNYLFIKTFGLVGAAYGTLLTYLITFILMQLLLYNRMNVRFYRAFYYAFTFYGQIIGLAKNMLGSSSSKTQVLVNQNTK